MVCLDANSFTLPPLDSSFPGNARETAKNITMKVASAFVARNTQAKAETYYATGMRIAG